MEETVRRLAYVAVLPFLLLALLVWVPAPSTAAGLRELFSYLAAAGLAALGGSWWGLVLARVPAADRVRASLLVIGMVAVALAVLTLLLPAAPGLLLGAVAYGLLRWLEILPSHRPLWPDWYHRLRSRLTWLVVLAHLSLYAWSTASWYHGTGAP